jgi:hypothetical protein
MSSVVYRTTLATVIGQEEFVRHRMAIARRGGILMRKLMSTRLVTCIRYFGSRNTRDSRVFFFIHSLKHLAPSII